MSHQLPEYWPLTLSAISIVDLKYRSILLDRHVAQHDPLQAQKYTDISVIINENACK
jgi:hypothetical protein